MTLTQLETFLEIAKSGSFSLAAEHLGYAQSTVTMQMKQLEDELQVPLFDRLGKKTLLTSFGERLVEHSEKMLEIRRDILSDLTADREPAGLLKIGISESLCYGNFPNLLLKFEQAFPKVEIRLSFVTHDSFPALLKNGGLDLVYTLNPLIEKDELRLVGKKEESLGFYVSVNHPLAKRKSICETDLKDAKLLVTGHNCSFRKMLLASLEDKKIAPNIVLETSSKEILKQFAINELGIAFLPDMSAIEEVKEGKLIRLNWTGRQFPIYSQILIHKDKRISKALEALIDTLQQSAPND